MTEERIMAFINSRKESDQLRQVLYHLFFRGEITPMVASEEYGISRLASCIWKLRHIHGFVIYDRLEYGKNRWGRTVPYAVYSL